MQDNRFCMVAMLMKMPISERGKWVCSDAIFVVCTLRTILHGGDVDADFQKRKVGMQGRNFFPKMGGTIWRKMPMTKNIEFGWPFYINILSAARVAFIIS